MFTILMGVLDGLQKGDDLGELCDDIVGQLLEAKISDDEIAKFLESMQRISELQAIVQRLRPEGGFPVRIYAPPEIQVMDTDCRSYLLQLEQDSILPPPLREVVIEQVMRLDDIDLCVERLQLLVTLVLFNQSGVETVLDYYCDRADASAQTIH